jgi:hypothetical protein
MMRAMAGNGLMFQNEAESRLQNHCQKEAECSLLTITEVMMPA